jgi:predicted 2-oxoglutarate/Fe(II)-dependent dioxygenase YbiX/peroxiredoxin
VSSATSDQGFGDVTAAGPRAYDTLFPGELAPWFRQRCIGQAGQFSFDMMAGRFVALCFYGAATDTRAREALELVRAHCAIFDTFGLSFFGVSTDAADESDATLAPSPGARHFADSDGVVSRAYGVAPRGGAPDIGALRRCWMVLDPRLRIIAIFPLDAAGNAAALQFLRGLPTPAAYGGQAQTPVLIIPGVFEPAICTRLIRMHQATGGVDSAILTEGSTVTDHGFKRRRDCSIIDKGLLAQVQTRIFRRVVPEIRHAFQFNATRLERLIVASYDAAEGGRFGPHRDNTVAATAHRRFAVSINLNDDFEGGGITFPEYSARAFCPPMGGALVFSCSMMHAVAPMTRGRRYACLPFVYDDAAAELRRGRAKG